MAQSTFRFHVVIQLNEGFVYSYRSTAYTAEKAYEHAVRDWERRTALMLTETKGRGEDLRKCNFTVSNAEMSVVMANSEVYE